MKTANSYSAISNGTSLPSPYGLLYFRSDLPVTFAPAGGEFTIDAARRLGTVALGGDLDLSAAGGPVEFALRIIHEPVHFLYEHTIENVYSADGLIPLVGQIPAQPSLLTIDDLNNSKVYGAAYQFLLNNKAIFGFSASEISSVQASLLPKAREVYNKYFVYSYAETFSLIKSGDPSVNLSLTADQLQALTRLNFTIEQARLDSSGQREREQVKEGGQPLFFPDGTSPAMRVVTDTKRGKILIYKEPPGLKTKAEKDAAKADINNYSLNPELDTLWIRQQRDEYKNITSQIDSIRKSDLDQDTKDILIGEILKDAVEEAINQNPDIFVLKGEIDGFLDRVYDILGENLFEFDGAQLGLALGSVLGKRITSNPFGQIAASGVLSTALGALGEALDGGKSTTNFLANGIDGLFDEALENIKGAGIGALSSYLTAELISALGVDGLAAELGTSFGSAALGQIINNIVQLAQGIKVVEGTGEKLTAFSGINATFVASIAASYVGGKLASTIKTFDNVGGQIGSAVGSAYGSYVAGAILASGPLSVPVIAAAVIAVAFWQLVGGLIGSVFGGTPRSGADVLWDEDQSQFIVTNVYSRKGGSKEAAQQLADAVSSGLNAILTATDSTPLHPEMV